MPIEAYDPMTAPDPGEWLELNEDERRQLVEDYHAGTGFDASALPAHATIHDVVESQVAEGDAIPVASRLRQLMAQGLDRHQAIHAIGSVLAQHIIAIARSGDDDPTTPRYYAALKRINAKKWLRSG